MYIITTNSRSLASEFNNGFVGASSGRVKFVLADCTFRTKFIPISWITQYRYHGYNFKLYKTKSAAKGIITRIINNHVSSLEELANLNLVIEEI